MISVNITKHEFSIRTLLNKYQSFDSFSHTYSSFNDKQMSSIYEH